MALTIAHPASAVRKAQQAQLNDGIGVMPGPKLERNAGPTAVDLASYSRILDSCEGASASIVNALGRYPCERSRSEADNRAHARINAETIS